MSIPSITEKVCPSLGLQVPAALKRYFPCSYSNAKPVQNKDALTVKLQEVLNRTVVLSIPEKQDLLAKADAVISKWKISDKPPQTIVQLERYALAVRYKFPLGLDKNEEGIQKLQENLQAHQSSLFKKWTKSCHFPPEVFFEFPDFVDFVFSSHLHKAFSYFGQSLKQINGNPCLLVEGRYRPWNEIKSKYVVEEGKIYLTENGEKRRCTYLESGLTEHNPDSWIVPKPLKILKEKPGQYSFQIVTSHVNENERNFFMDGVLKGARHTWFRLITPQGEVYSFGRGFNPDEFDVLQPLAGVKAVIQSPDTFEYYADHRLETTLPISEDQGKKVMQIIMTHAQGDKNFNFIDSNCAEFTQEVLSAAGIEKIPHQVHISEGLAKLLIPKIIRKVFKFIWKYSLHLVLPSFVKKALVILKNFLVSLIFLPLFSLLGGWRSLGTNAPAPVTPAPEALVPPQIPEAPQIDGEADILQDRTVRTVQVFVQFVRDFVKNNNINQYLRQQARRPFYNSLWDIMNPNKLVFSVTHRIAKWQRQQGDKTKFY